MARRSWVLRMWGWYDAGSVAFPVMTTLSTPSASSSLCQSGRSATIASYKSTAMRRDIVTIIALPASTSRRASQ
jgi:hypothetical protein